MTGDRCDYATLGPDSPEWLRCIAPSTTVVDVMGDTVRVCRDHVARLDVLVRLIDVDVEDTLDATRYDPSGLDEFAPERHVSCPPNAHHGGTIAYTSPDALSRCPVCGRVNA